MIVKFPTQVIGQGRQFPFKTTGKEILKKGWVFLFETADSVEKKLSGILTETLWKGLKKGPTAFPFWKAGTKPPKTIYRSYPAKGLGNRRQNKFDDEECGNLWKKTALERPIYPVPIYKRYSGSSDIIRNKKGRCLPTQTWASIDQYYSNDC